MLAFISGISGMLGHALAPAFLEAGWLVRGSGTREHGATALSSDVDYQQHAFEGWELRRLQEVVGPADLVIHAAAYTKVDQAQVEEAEAHRVNWLYTQALAHICEDLGIPLLYMSSDYVFNGLNDRPYREYDSPEPLGAYGRSKLAGEVATRRLPRHYIVRSQWLYGEHGPNFIKTILKAAIERPELRVVDDQHGSPTYVEDLAAAIVKLVSTGRFGIHHLTNQGATTWYDFAKEIVRTVNLSTPVYPQSSTEAARPAPRPAMGVLENYAWHVAGEAPLPGWADALHRFLVRSGS